MSSKATKKIITFLALTLAFSSIYYFLIISGGSVGGAGGLYVLGLMWAPGIAGMVTQLVYEHTLRGLGWKLGKAKYLLVAFLLPLGYCLLVYGITWLSGLGGFPDPGLMAMIQERWGGLTRSPALQILLTVVLTAFFGMIGGLISGLGEEIGWRGLFVPELYKVTTFTKTSLISGAVWGLWHFPLLFFADYNLPGAPRWYAGLMFAILVIGVSFAFAWLRLKSGSLWTAAVLHAAHNVFIQTIFTPLTIQNQITPYIIDEFGAGLALAAVVVALIFWSKRGELPPGKEEDAGAGVTEVFGAG
ncbi:MAG: CPBP family intramembrane metalloprotease [Chloroflexi bacterium]|nr:MAG: CPBP family intramembrane metalloprotease [Chloroflexota bacterium]